MIGLDPTPFGMICGGILKYGRNPNTARLFLAWLASPEGAITFEKMTKRGNFFVAGTETSKLLKDRKLSFFTAEQSIAQAKKLNALEAEFSRKLAGRLKRGDRELIRLVAAYGRARRHHPAENTTDGCSANQADQPRPR